MGLWGFEEAKSMHMRLDDIELIKRIDRDGAVEEIRSVHNVSVSGRRRIVELRIPGSQGNVFQDLGREPLTISFDGELVGTGAKNTLEELKSKFELRKPVPFSSDITTIGDVAEVVIEDFTVHFVGGAASGSWYSMVMKEHRSPGVGGGGSTEAPSQEESAKKDVQQRAREIFDGVRSPG